MVRKPGNCTMCNKLAELVAKQLCHNCYVRNGTPLVECRECGRVKNHHAKGYCRYCYYKTFYTEYSRLASRKQYTGITRETFEKLQMKCLICGFDKVFDVHHLVSKAKGGSHDISNLITLCPNHHKMTHHADYREEMLALIQERLERGKTATF